jgi:hypothetical protein
MKTQETITIKCSQTIDFEKMSTLLLFVMVMSVGLFTSTFATAQTLDPQQNTESVSSPSESVLPGERVASDRFNYLSPSVLPQEPVPTFSAIDATFALISGALVGGVIGVVAAEVYLDTSRKTIVDLVIGGAIGIGAAPIGVALGIYGYGKVNGFDGSYLATFEGTLAGAAVGGLPVLFMDADLAFLMRSVSVFALVGGLWGFYASLPNKTETGRLTQQFSMGMPSFTYSKTTQDEGQYMLYLTGGQF